MILCSEENQSARYGCAYRFWYDTKEKDCKIAKLHYTVQHWYGKVCKVYVFSLAAGSWKIITNETLPYIDSQLLCVNEELHWVSKRYNDENLRIDINLVSLNLNTSKFRENLIPTTTTKQVSSYFMRDFDNRSIVLFPYIDKQGSCISVQVYDTNSNQFYFIYSDDDRCRRPLGFRNNGDVLFRDSEREKMFSYNLQTRKYKDFVTGKYDNVERRVNFNGEDIRGTFAISSIFPFVETLVLLDNKDCN